VSTPLVIKFGGSSLATAARIRRAARRVRAQVRRGRRVAVVVSANGGATDRIVRLLARVSAGGRPAPREADRALATGEDLSAALLASALCALGVSARSLRGGEAGVWAEGGFCGGRIADVDPAPLRGLLRAGTVPVVSGFQGAREDGETVTLGRGASDLSAVAIAAALGAECHIVTDVRGVFDRDPRTDAGARFFARIDHRQLLRLAEGGARVVQREAAAEALRAGVALRIYHFAAGVDGEGGTVVSVAAAQAGSERDSQEGSERGTKKTSARAAEATATSTESLPNSGRLQLPVTRLIADHSSPEARAGLAEVWREEAQAEAVVLRGIARRAGADAEVGA
jgi:aspartate kinase